MIKEYYCDNCQTYMKGTSTIVPLTNPKEYHHFKVMKCTRCSSIIFVRKEPSNREEIAYYCPDCQEFVENITFGMISILEGKIIDDEISPSYVFKLIECEKCKRRLLDKRTSIYNVEMKKDTVTWNDMEGDIK